MTRSPLAAGAAALLLQHGPQTLEDLFGLAVAAGHTRARTSSGLRDVLRGPAFVQRPDGSHDTAARLLRGQVLTVRRSCLAPDGTLWTCRDLDPLAVLPALPLVGGGALRRGVGDVEAWVGLHAFVSAAPLLGLRWDGTQLTPLPVDDVPAPDSDVVQEAREVLARHARAERGWGCSAVGRGSATHAVLSALVERPTLFADPLPPLRELLPLPQDLRPSDHLMPVEPARRLVQVPLSERVHGELARRADLLGEPLEEHLALLLTAAADRAQATTRPSAPEYRYDHECADDVIVLDAWRR